MISMLKVIGAELCVGRRINNQGKRPIIAIRHVSAVVGWSGETTMTEPYRDQPTQANDQELLKAYLADRDASCPACKYNLRGCEAEKCPECGAILELRIWSTALNLGAWISALVCLAVPFVILLISILALPLSMQEQGDDKLVIWLGIALLLILISVNGIALYMVFHRRNRFLKMRTSRQWLVSGFIMFIILSCIGSMFVASLLDQ